jgi:hypothetical protein
MAAYNAGEERGAMSMPSMNIHRITFRKPFIFNQGPWLDMLFTPLNTL